MTCYHPLKRWIKGFHTKKNDNGIMTIAEDAIITSYKKNSVTLPNGKKLTEYQEIPCGKCIGCRLEYSKKWAMRCMLEAKDHEFNEFITLTYDDDSVPHAKGVINFETGEMGDVLTLDFDDLQKFMKRLRIEFKRKYGVENIRFYACGEYGRKTERPHYHIICFNCPLPDKKLDVLTKKGQIQYKSEFLEKIWGKGRVRTSPVNFETCAYVARYVMKKVKGKEAIELFEDTGRVPEGVRMSRKPGIAKNYYDENKDKIYQSDEIWLKNKYGPVPLKPPRYFDNLYDIDNPDKMYDIKQNRKENAKISEKTREQTTGIDKITHLEQMETFKKHQIERLKRQIV